MNKLRDDVDYYIESSTDPDYQENLYIYDDINFDELNHNALEVGSSSVFCHGFSWIFWTALTFPRFFSRLERLARVRIRITTASAGFIRVQRLRSRLRRPFRR